MDHSHCIVKMELWHRFSTSHTSCIGLELSSLNMIIKFRVNEGGQEWRIKSFSSILWYSVPECKIPLLLNVMIIENLSTRLTYYQPFILQFKIQIILRRGEGAIKVSTTFLKCTPVHTSIIVNRKLCITLQSTVWLHIHLLVVESYWLCLYWCRLRITFTAAHTAADVEALVKALPPWIKSKGPSPNFLPTPVYWLPASLSKDVKQRSLQPANGESQDKRPGEAHVLLIRPKL